MSGTHGTAPRGGLTERWRTIMLMVLGLAGAAVLVALIVSQGEANRQRDRALALQAHSYDVMILARTLSGTIATAEATLGRYVISGDRQIGQLYSEEWQTAGQQIDTLDRITRVGSVSRPRLVRLRAAYRERGDELSLIALSTAYKKNPQALARYYQARRAPSLAAIDGTLDALIVTERRLLNQRTATAMDSVASSTAATRVLAVFGILLALGAIALGWLTVAAQAERAVARAEADEERRRAAELATAVAEATDALRIKEERLRQVQKMEAVGQLTGGIAHDFNNMLAVVVGGLELARRQLNDDPAGAARHIDSATEGANRAAALTRRLLAFSREEALQPEPIGAATLIAGMSDLLDRTLGDGVTMAVTDDSRGWTVFADKVQLENAILNLAVNARDAMDGRGRLAIATGGTMLAAEAIGTCRAGDYVTIAVSDSGCGMTPDVIERVFEPFFTTKPVGKGTGLGLSQIFALVRSLGGEIAIRSAPGHGSTVTLYLPRHHAVGSVAAVPTPTPTIAGAPPAASGPLVVLVVEDDPRVLAATLGAVEELGHRAIGCDDPLAAPAMLSSHEAVDLVISDVLMPSQTGPEMIAGLIGDHPDLAVLFVTGFAGEAGGASEFGGRPVLRKPYTLAALERAIAAAAGIKRPAPPEQWAAE